jgi:hypothetical protein
LRFQSPFLGKIAQIIRLNPYNSAASGREIRRVLSLPHDIVLLNHIHLLFEPTLQQDPLRLLQNLSRRKTIVVIWEGELQGPHLVYAAPEHPEYRRYPARELVMVHPFAIV